MGIMSDAGRSIAGNVESAYLIVKDYRKDPTSGIDESMGNAIRMTAMKLETDIIETNSYAFGKRFKVQFNPNELKIYAAGIDVSPKKNAQADKNGVHGTLTGQVDPTVELTLTLIFDQVNTYDAFMFDKVSVGAASAITNAASVIGAMTGKKVWTVQTEVEGLLGALANHYTQCVCFQWNKFEFTGRLKNVSAKYTMFSVSGRPIRAQVLLRLKQHGKSAPIGEWYDDFDELVKKDSYSSGHIGDKVGNLLNIGL